MRSSNSRRSGDAVEFQRRLRAEWTREWDADYEETKAEFPDLFEGDDPIPYAERIARARSRGM